MNKQVDFERVLSILSDEVKRYDVPFVEFLKVQTKDPFKILVAVVLSSRTKDELTAKVCSRLFKIVNDVVGLNSLSVEMIEKLIYPVGFYKTKAKNLKKISEILISKDLSGFDTVEKLLLLPGVGRKSANLIVSQVFLKPGICVDTHVHKIVNRLGFVSTKTPNETELKLKKMIKEKYWSEINNVFVPFGQFICRPVSPFCSKCPIEMFCNKVGVDKNR
jgi:endonuclease III